MLLKAIFQGKLSVSWTEQWLWLTGHRTWCFPLSHFTINNDNLCLLPRNPWESYLQFYLGDQTFIRDQSFNLGQWSKCGLLMRKTLYASFTTNKSGVLWQNITIRRYERKLGNWMIWKKYYIHTFFTFAKLSQNHGKKY